MVGRGDGGTCGWGARSASLTGSPSPLLLPPTAQSHGMVWGPCCRLWSLPEHTVALWPFPGRRRRFLAAVPRAGSVLGPKCQSSSTQPGVMAASESSQQGQDTAGEMACWEC